MDRSKAVSTKHRTFPFDTSLLTNDFYARGYGSGLKTAATAAIAMPTEDTSLYTGDSLNGFQTTGNFKFQASMGTIAGETGQSAGVVSFKLVKATGWGGSCCKAADSCADSGAKCDK